MNINGEVLAKATARQVRISPRKLRLVLDLVKGKQVEIAQNLLQFSTKKGARIVLKTLQSALANADFHKVNVDSLWITGGWVDSGPTMRRYMPGAHGRANPIRKRTSHVTVVLGER